MGLEVLLSNPVQTKAIAYVRIKNDTVDATTLVHLLRTDLLATCWIPQKAERNLRDLLRIRLNFLCFRSQFKNVIRSILAKFNINLERNNLWSGQGREPLEETISPGVRDALARLTLPSPYDETIKQCLAHIDTLNEQIKYWEGIIHEQAVISEDAQRLLTVPGIGNLSALTIIYESGPIGRFYSTKHYASYADLVPRNCGRAYKYWNVHLCKQANMYLKRIYVEIALAALRSNFTDLRLKWFYERTMRRKGRFVARIALARKIAGIVSYILKNKIDYPSCMAKNRWLSEPRKSFNLKNDSSQD